jgi:cyclic pyranopterin phosphate synthase
MTVPVPVVIGVRQRTATPVAAHAAMPTTGPLLDPYGRVHTDLRLSVTDHCNLRCVYCMPDEGMTFLPSRDLLTFEEFFRVARVARQLGVRKLRITGGEPLVRRNIVELVTGLSALDFDDLALTTNGTGLARLAAPLVAAGLKRVNVSCDSLRSDRFADIRRRGTLSVVLRAMDVAEAAGLRPVKVNVVLLRGRNDDEILDFADFARRTGRTVRFIEFMPLDGDGAWSRDNLVSGRHVFGEISKVWPLEPIADGSDQAPAERFRFADGGRGEIGLISSVTEPFCGTCNRLRLTADGALRNCLFTNEEQTVRGLLRQGGSDADLAQLFRQVVWGKLPGHGINDPGFLSPARSMSMIGG